MLILSEQSDSKGHSSLATGGWPTGSAEFRFGVPHSFVPERVRFFLFFFSRLSSGQSPGSVPHLTLRPIDKPERAAPNADFVLSPEVLLLPISNRTSAAFAVGCEVMLDGADRTERLRPEDVHPIQ